MRKGKGRGGVPEWVGSLDDEGEDAWVGDELWDELGVCGDDFQQLEK